MIHVAGYEAHSTDMLQVEIFAEHLKPVYRYRLTLIHKLNYVFPN